MSVVAKTRAPIPTQIIGKERGSSLSSIGIQAVSNTRNPNPVRTTM
jgi:hypothetical protein